MRASRVREIDQIGKALQRSRRIYAWDVDELEHTVTFFVPENEEGPPLPAAIGGYTVYIRPTSKLRMPEGS
jgi:hypothetical protein